MSKKLLVVVDYQNDFVDGALGFEKATKIAPYIISLVKKYEEEGEDVWFTKDTHFNNYLETQEGKNLPVPHCISQTKGHELYGELQSLSRNHTVIEKNTFPSLMLANLLKDTAYEEVRVVGVVTDICVISNCFVLFPHFVLHLANDSTIMRTILKGDFNNGNQSRKSKDS